MFNAIPVYNYCQDLFELNDVNKTREVCLIDFNVCFKLFDLKLPIEFTISCICLSAEVFM